MGKASQNVEAALDDRGSLKCVMSKEVGANRHGLRMTPLIKKNDRTANFIVRNEIRKTKGTFYKAMQQNTASFQGE